MGGTICSTRYQNLQLSQIIKECGTSTGMENQTNGTEMTPQKQTHAYMV